jgi:hypothetical protein
VQAAGLVTDSQEMVAPEALAAAQPRQEQVARLHLLGKALLVVTEELRLAAAAVALLSQGSQVLAAMVVMAGLRRQILFLEHPHITQVVVARPVFLAAQMD